MATQDGWGSGEGEDDLQKLLMSEAHGVVDVCPVPNVEDTSVDKHVGNRALSLFRFVVS